MKIKKLMQIFERCIPTYQKAVDEKWQEDQLYMNNMGSGLCLFIGKAPITRKYTEIQTVFEKYYFNFLKSDFLFPTIGKTHASKQIKLCIKPRLEFLKQQVEQLKKLEKKGYTHV